MINPEAKEEWKSNPVTLEMLVVIEQEKTRLVEAMGNGNFLNLENMQESFGAMAQCIGEIAGLNTASKLLQEG